MEIKLKLDANRITLDDLIMLDEMGTAKLPARQVKEFVARFIIGDDGQYLDYAEAFALAGKLSLGELKATFDQMGDKIKELQATAVPPEISGG